MNLFVESIGFGLLTSAVLALAAVGFTLQFAVTNVLNLAYGGVMIVAAYAAYAVNQAGVSIWIGALAAIAAGSLLSLCLNTFIYRPFQRRGTTPIAMVIVSLGMTLILVFGTQAAVSYTHLDVYKRQVLGGRVGSLPDEHIADQSYQYGTRSTRDVDRRSGICPSLLTHTDSACRFRPI